jgi:large subunit ribosomal protein L29
MKRKDYIGEIRGLSEQDLAERARTLSEELMKLRFRNASGQLDQHHRVREAKTSLARVLTVLKQKRQAEAGA